MRLDPVRRALAAAAAPAATLRRSAAAYARSLATLLLLLAPAAACTPAVATLPATSTASQTAERYVYPGDEWERIADPRTVGYDAAGLERLRARLESMPTTAFMAVVGGRVLFEHGDVETVSYLASVRKSVLSMLYGIYVERGVIRLDRTLAQLGIDDHQTLSTREKQATVAHLLAARSGVFHPAANGGDDLASAPRRGSRRPGTYYLYSNWDFNALGTIFEQQTGRSIYDALEEDLVRPLGMRDFDRAAHRRTGDSTRSVHLAYHMNLSTRDMARIGYLMLRNGAWADRQIVPADWVRESTRPVTRVHQMNPARRRDGTFGYGYLWWVFDRPELGRAYDGAYVGLGAVGQQILVMPALDLVVVHKTAPAQGRNVTHDEFLDLVRLLLRAR